MSEKPNDTMTSTGSIVSQPESLPPSLSQIEEEIKSYISQISLNVIEIGKRLIHAKSLVQHGQWTQWLQNNFQLTDRTARNFMQCAERFGKTEVDFRFSSTQMIALLALPEDDTSKFIEEHATEGTPVFDMSVKTLRNEIKLWKSKSTDRNENIPDSANLLSDTPPHEPENSTATVSKQINVEEQFVSSSTVNYEVIHVDPEKQDEQTYSQTFSKLPPLLPRIDSEPHSEKFTLSLRPNNHKTHNMDVLFKTSNELLMMENLKQYIMEYAVDDEDYFRNDVANFLKLADILREIVNGNK